MNGNTKRIPTSSQTVGPFFRIGLQYLIDRTLAPSTGPDKTVEIRGRVVDRDGAPVADAMLEFWSGHGEATESGIPDGFRRAATDEKGAYAVAIAGPHAEARHFVVMVFARGLLRHLITRVYLGDEANNNTDAVLLQVPPERRATLIARADEKQPGLYWWDIVLQGSNETVFFAW